jgi:hypothetical protein
MRVLHLIDYIEALYPDAVTPKFSAWLGTFASVPEGAEAIRSRADVATAPQPFLQFVDMAEAFDARRKAGELPADREELSYDLLQNFFPDAMKYTNRAGWSDVYQSAMTPNPMGVTGVVISNPCATDCIAFAGRLCASA